jgi:hypothetical protein
LFVSDEPCAIHDRCAGVVLAGNQTYLPALAFDPFTAQLPGSTSDSPARRSRRVGTARILDSRSRLPAMVTSTRPTLPSKESGRMRPDDGSRPR